MFGANVRTGWKAERQLSGEQGQIAATRSLRNFERSDGDGRLFTLLSTGLP